MTTTESLVRFAGTIPQPANDQVSVDPIRMFGHPVWVAYRRHDREWARRAQVGVGAVEDIATLAVLMELPTGMPVSLRCLHPAEQRVLWRLPRGVVRLGAGGVIRDLVPVVTLLLAMVPADEDWLRAAEVASGFAVHCPRLVLLSRPAERAGGVVDDVARDGIGVVTVGAGVPQVLAEPEPEPIPDWRFTPAGWAFDEEIYAQVRPGAHPSGR